jgi:hypothetical protein
VRSSFAVRRPLRAAAVALALFACAGPESDAPDAADAQPDATIVRPVIPPDADPCREGDRWPLSIASTTRPMLVHYQVEADAATAAAVVALLDRAADVAIDRLGLRPPLPDGGRCGPDARLDVFLWAGIDECYVDVIDEVEATAYDDRLAYLVLDPWGSFGGPLLPTTVAHELTHVLQAADDWSDLPFIYEASAVLVEDEVWDDDDQYLAQVADFAAHPDWSIDRDDGYQTWSMYGAAQFLRFLRDRYHRGDARFLGRLWWALRSDADNEPDALDGVAAILAGTGATVDDAVIEFARWRWYTGAWADGAHLEEAAAMPPPARAGVVAARGGRQTVTPMVRGTVYLDLAVGPDDPAAVTVALRDADPAVTWVVLALPGAGSDGDRLDLGAGPAAIDPRRVRTLAITALAPGADADDRTDRRYAATVVIAPR